MKNEKNKWREMNGNEREKRGKHAFISFTCAFLFFIVFCLFFFLIKITHSVPFICILIRKKTNQELQLGEDTEGRVVSERRRKGVRSFLTYPFILLHSSLQHTRNYNWSWISQSFLLITLPSHGILLGH